MLVAVAFAAAGSFVVLTEAGTRLALRTTISWYSNAIAGDASFRAVDGTIADQVTLHHLELKDVNGRNLVTAQAVRVSIDLWELTDRHVAIESFVVEGAQLDLPANGARFSDLTPIGGADEPPPSDLFGPDLPVRVSGRLSVLDSTLAQAGEAAVAIEKLELGVDAENTSADVHIAATFEVPGADLEIRNLVLAAAWTDPAARIDALRVETNWGALRLDKAELDLARESVAIRGLTAVAAAARWRAAVGRVDAVAPHVTLNASGGLEAWTGVVIADAGADGRLAVELNGSLRPQIELRAEMTANTDIAIWQRSADAQPLGVDGSFHAAGTLETGFRGSAELRCDPCSGAMDPVQAYAQATVSRRPSDDAWTATGGGRVELHRSRIRISGSADSEGSVEAKLEFDPLDLRELSSGAGLGSSVRGTVEGYASCVGVLTDVAGTCDLRIELTDGDPIRSATLAASASTQRFQTNSVTLRALRVAHRNSTTIRLIGSRARAEVSPDRWHVDGLSLGVATATGDGRIDVEGHLEDRTRGELTVRVRHLDLGATAAFVPELDLDGHVRGTARIRGTLANPEATVSIRASRLSAGGVAVGNAETQAGFDEGKATVRMHVEGGDLGHWKIDGRAPLDASLQPFTFSPRPRERVHLDVSGGKLDLRPLLSQVTDGPAVSGRLTIDAALRGTAQNPAIDLGATADDVALAGTLIGDVELVSKYRSGAADARVRVVSPRLKTLRASAEVPISVSLMGPLRWRPKREHKGSVTLQDADLALISDLGGPPLQGLASLEAGVAGPATSPNVEFLASVEGLTLQGRQLATGVVNLRYADQAVNLVADLRGPDFSGFGATASIPVSIAPLEGKLHWHPDGRHDIEVALVGVPLAHAVRWLPTPLDVGGHVDATVKLHGTPVTPQLQVRLEGRSLTYGGRAVGTIGIQAGYSGAQAALEAQWDRDARHRVRLETQVPLDVDIPHGTITWNESRPHRLRLDAPRVDRTLLESFVEIPDELHGAVSLHVVGDGPIDRLALAASARGYFQPEGAQKIPVAFDLDATPHAQRLTTLLGSSAAVEVETQAQLARLREDAASWPEIPLAGRVRLDETRLSFLADLFPEHLHAVEGTLDLDTLVGGTVGSPTFRGEANVTSGAATLVAIRQRLEAISASVEFTHDQIRLTRLNLRSGRGTLTGRGTLEIEDGQADATINLDLERLPARVPGLPGLELTSRIQAGAQAGPTGIGIELGLAKSRIDVLASNIEAAEPIPTSSRVQFVSHLGRSSNPDTEHKEASAVPFDGQLVLRDPIRIRGPAVDMAWSGAVQASSRNGAFSVTGALKADEGFIDLVTNRFSLERGTITLAESESLQVYTELVANTRVADFDVTATIRGPLPRPELSLSSTPSLSESQVFTLLVSGSPAFDEADPEKVQTQAAALLAALSNPTLQRQVNERLRVDRIGVGFGETTNEPILTVGKNITRRVYAETQYHHNAPADSNSAELRVRYRFAPRWSLESFAGDAAEAGLDIFWGRTFNSGRRASSKDPSR